VSEQKNPHAGVGVEQLPVRVDAIRLPGRRRCVRISHCSQMFISFAYIFWEAQEILASHDFYKY
jgi:hypothetical protein